MRSQLDSQLDTCTSIRTCLVGLQFLASEAAVQVESFQYKRVHLACAG